MQQLMMKLNSIVQKKLKISEHVQNVQKRKLKIIKKHKPDEKSNIQVNIMWP